MSEQDDEETTETLTAYEWWRDLRAQQDRKTRDRPFAADPERSNR